MAESYLPPEFEEIHGSIDLDGPGIARPKREDGSDSSEAGDFDEELDMAGTDERMWLCRVPKFLFEKWSEPGNENDVLGRVRVYDKKGPDGNPLISIILNEQEAFLAPSEPGAAPVNLPREYNLTIQNTASKNLYVFGEKEEELTPAELARRARQRAQRRRANRGGDSSSDEEAEAKAERYQRKRRRTSVLVTVNHECYLSPSMSDANAQTYRNILRERQKKAAEPRRSVKLLDVDVGTANRLASGMGSRGLNTRIPEFLKTRQKTPQQRVARIPKNELLDLLFIQFDRAPYWQLKILQEHIKQPLVYLKEVLNEIAHLIPRGPYAGMWKLKDEFKDRTGPTAAGGAAAASTSAAPSADVDTKPQIVDMSKDDDDSDVEMVPV